MIVVTNLCTHYSRWAGQMIIMIMIMFILLLLLLLLLLLVRQTNMIITSRFIDERTPALVSLSLSDVEEEDFPSTNDKTICYTILHCTILYYAILYYAIVHYNIIYYYVNSYKDFPSPMADDKTLGDFLGTWRIYVHVYIYIYIYIYIHIILHYSIS